MSGQTQQQIEFRVANLDCEHDAAQLKRRLSPIPGIHQVDTYPRAAKVRIVFDPDAVKPETIEEHLASAGFPVVKDRELPEPPKPWHNPKVITAATAGLLLLVGFLMGRAGVPEPVTVVVYVVAMVVGGYFFGREAIEELVHERRVGIELLMSVAAVVAALMGQPAEGAMLVFLYAISEAAEGYTEEKTRSAIKALMKLAPKVALVRRNGREVEIPAEELQVGDIFIVKPGQSIPTDGVVVRGHSSVDQSPVTGESIPVEKKEGDVVFAGTINQHGALEVRATRTVADNTLSRIIQLVEEAQERKGERQKFVERFGAWYSPAVLLAGVLIAVVPPLFFGAAWTTWILRATVFIVAAAPCALVISIPITMVAALGTAARNGILVKGGIHLEMLAQSRVVALDKTGTLTRGEPQVTDVIPWTTDGQEPVDEERVLLWAAAVEARSEHPLARAIVREGQRRELVPPPVEHFQALPGTGAVGVITDRRVLVARPSYFETYGALPDALKKRVAELEDEGKTVVLVGVAPATDGATPRVVGLIALRDVLRPNAKEAIAALRQVGITRIAMLTGDNPRAARAIARELGIDDVYAELSPEDKVRKVRELTARYGHVIMVGDGVNDAPALAEATVGVAMGAAGTDVALETADVALMADDLEKLAYAIHLARRTQRVVQQNLIFSAAVITVLVIGALAGRFTLPIAVLGHELSEFAVIASGLRMLRG